MEKLVLVVHGIGEQAPGETVDELVGGLSADSGAQIDAQIAKLRGLDPQVKDPKADAREMPLFDCHIRRVSTGTDRVTFAEVFWGDLSRGAKNQITTLIQLFMLVMGLGHILRENRKALGVGKKWDWFWSEFFIHLLHGPLAVSNLAFALVLVSFFFLHALEQLWGGKIPDTALASLAMLIAASGLLGAHAYLNGPPSGRLFRIFVRWLRIVSAFLIGVVILAEATLFFDYAGGDPTGLMGKESWPKGAECVLILTQAKFVECIDAWYVRMMLAPTGIAYLLALICVAAVIIPYWIANVLWALGLYASDDYARARLQQQLYPSTMALMFSAWAFLVMVAWFGLKSVLEARGDLLDSYGLEVFEHAIAQGISQVVSIAVAFLFVVLFAAAAFLLRWLIISDNTVRYWRIDGAMPQMIIHRLIHWGLFVSSVILFVGVAIEFCERAGISLPDWIDGATEYVRSFGPYAIFAAAALAGAYLTVWRSIAGGLGVVQDVVMFFQQCDGAGTEPDYPARGAIQHRFDHVFKYLARQQQWDDVVVVSHSLGTLVAVQSLRSGDMHGALKAAPGTMALPQHNLDGRMDEGVLLVTMGSPVRQLFHRYFATRPAQQPEEDELDKLDKEDIFFVGKETEKGTRRWINIFRVDDYVGTFVFKQNLKHYYIENIAVPKKGHTGYWTDDLVTRHILTHAVPELASEDIKRGAEARIAHHWQKHWQRIWLAEGGSLRVRPGGAEFDQMLNEPMLRRHLSIYPKRTTFDWILRRARAWLQRLLGRQAK